MRTHAHMVGSALLRGAVLLLFGLCASVRYSTAQNLLITDYRVPISTAEALRVNLDFDYKRVGGQEIDNRENIFANYTYFYDSLRFAYSIDATLTAEKAEDERLSITSDENVRAYLVKNLFAGAEFRRTIRTREDPDVVALAGFGVGRFINATPLAKAVRMEDWLLELDQLYDDLPADTMILLAQLIQREDEFREKHGEGYRAYWFEAMAHVIRQSGMLKVPRLDAMAFVRMDEVLTRERVFDRFYGWEVSSGASTRIFGPDEPLKRPAHSLELTARFARPMGQRTQWNEKATITSPINDSFRDAWRLTVESDFSYEVSNRIDLLVTHTLSVDRSAADVIDAVDPIDFDTGTTQRLQGTFVFFVENALTLNVNGIVSVSKERKQRGITVTFGYRLF